MVKRCSWGLCKSDSRHHKDITFVPFPKPKKNLDQCLRWIKLCGRPHSQLDVNSNFKDRHVCSLHFASPHGPTDQFPDPRPACVHGSVGSTMREARVPSNKRQGVKLDESVTLLAEGGRCVKRGKSASPSMDESVAEAGPAILLVEGGRAAETGDDAELNGDQYDTDPRPMREQSSVGSSTVHESVSITTFPCTGKSCPKEVETSSRWVPLEDIVQLQTRVEMLTEQLAETRELLSTEKRKASSYEAMIADLEKKLRKRDQTCKKVEKQGKAHVSRLEEENEKLKNSLKDWIDREKMMKQELDSLKLQKRISVETVQQSKITDFFRYCTGLTYESFRVLFEFLIPNPEENNIMYTRKCKSRKSLSLENQLFLMLLKLRCNMDYCFIGYLFDVSIQDVGTLFTSWINYSFVRLMQLPLWQHRNDILSAAPKSFLKDFPTTIAIADCTELGCQMPSSLLRQSQTFSDYKSTNTWKALVVCDPRGRLLFTSPLFTGSISDKEIVNQSGLMRLLEDLMQKSFILPGDSLMCDKGFLVEEDFRRIDLRINIPPFAQSERQMPTSDVELTKKIATHRVHVERLIRRIKCFEMLSDRVQIVSTPCINQVWFVCCVLTSFMPDLIRDIEEDPVNRDTTDHDREISEDEEVSEYDQRIDLGSEEDNAEESDYPIWSQ